MRVSGLVVAAVLLAVAGCTGEEPPSPPPPPVEETAPPSPVGTQISVVLYPRTGVAEAVTASMEADLVRLLESYEPDVRIVRPLVPDASVFIGDLAELAARGEMDLTCVFGATGRQILSSLRELHPAERFCAITPNDLPEETEDGIDVVAVRTVELGHAIGVGASQLAGPGAVVLALGSSEVERGRFLDGMTAGLGATRSFTVDPDLDAEEAIAAAMEDGATVVVVGTGPEAPAYLEAALAAELTVVAHAAVAEPFAQVAMTWRLRWDLVLAPAVDRLLEREEPGSLDLGFGDGVFEVVAGPAASPELSETIAAVLAELAAGARDPFEMVPGPEPDGPGDPPAPEDPGDADDGADADDAEDAEDAEDTEEPGEDQAADEQADAEGTEGDG